MAYEIALLATFLGIAFYFIYFADRFKIEGENAWKALTNGLLSVLMKLMSVATVIYTIFFVRLMLQDQTVSAHVTNILKIYDTYLQIFVYGFCVVFFIIFFINQFTTLSENMKIYKQIKKERGTFNKE